MKYGMTESFTLISMLIFGAGIKSFTTRMFKSNSGEPYAGKLHVRFLEEFISNCLIIKEGENLLMQITVIRKSDNSVITRIFEDEEGIKEIIDDDYEVLIEKDSN